jgi:hypothetical protein
VTGVVTRLTVTEPWFVGWPLFGSWQEISADAGIPEQEYVSGKTVVLLLLLMKPVVLLTVIGIFAVPPTPMGNVLAVEERVKVSVVLVIVRLTVAEVPGELVGTIVIVCGPEGNAMLATVEIVNVVETGFIPSKVTLGGLKLHVAPVGKPEQLLGAKLTTFGVDPVIAEMVKVAEPDCPAGTEMGVRALAVSWKSGFKEVAQARARASASTEPRPVT